MRPLIPAFLTAVLLSACVSVVDQDRVDIGALASVEGANSGLIAAAQADHLHASQMAQLRDIAEAEARVDLARARLDLDSIRNNGPADGDAREFLDARRALRDARNVYGPTDTGRTEWGVFYGLGWPRRDRGRNGHWGQGVRGTFGIRPDSLPEPGQGQPLSALSGSGAN